MFNRNKKSIGIDLRHPAGAEAARRIAASADVVAENFKPGTLVKFGLDYASLAALDDRLDLRRATRASCRARTSTAPRSTRWCR